MKKTFAVLMVVLLITFGSGLVTVDLNGPKKYLGGPVGSVIDDAVAIIEANLPWADIVSLDVQKKQMSKSYMVIDPEKVAKYQEQYDRKFAQLQDELQKKGSEWEDDYLKKLVHLNKEFDDKGIKYKKKFDGFTHVLLEGIILGDNGQQLEIAIDVDYSSKSVNAITVIGDEGSTEIYRKAWGTKGTYTLNKETTAFAAGDFSLISNTTSWDNQPVYRTPWAGTPVYGGVGTNIPVSGNVFTMTGDVTSQQSWQSQGSGSFDSTTISDNFVFQKSAVTLPGSPYSKKGRK